MTFATRAEAQVAPVVTDVGVENRFPEGITFRVEATSDSEIEEIRFRYEILPDGTSANGVPEFERSESVEAAFELTQIDSPLPPGTIVEYHWEVTDADGDVGESDTASYYYDDPRFSWGEVTGDGATIHYYSGSDEDAQEMHNRAVETLTNVGTVLGAESEVPEEVHIWVYDSPDDMRPVLQKISATRDEGVITAGVRVATNTVLVLGENSFDTLQHELTHVVTAAAGEGVFQFMPFWLDEGTAVYFQGAQGGFQDAIERAIDKGNVFSIRQITTIAGDPNQVNLFYGQSWHVVKYLIETYGEEQFAALFAEMKSGKRIDSALEAVYGFDQDGLEDEWRDENGLSARVTAEPESTDDEPEVVTPTEDDDGGASMTLVLIAAVLGLAVVVGGGGIMLARRMK